MIAMSFPFCSGFGFLQVGPGRFFRAARAYLLMDFTAFSLNSLSLAIKSSKSFSALFLRALPFQ
jgi:hypothetical protein